MVTSLHRLLSCVGVDLSCDGNEIIEYVGLNIHGDNIVECERAFILIQGAWADDISDIEGPFGSVVCPKFNLSLKGRDAPLEITFFPGFGRWNHDILASIRERGGSLREAADVVVTALHPQEETPYLLLSFVGLYQLETKLGKEVEGLSHLEKLKSHICTFLNLAGLSLTLNGNVKHHGCQIQQCRSVISAFLSRKILLFSRFLLQVPVLTNNREQRTLTYLEMMIF